MILQSSLKFVPQVELNTKPAGRLVFLPRAAALDHVSTLLQIDCSAKEDQDDDDLSDPGFEYGLQIAITIFLIEEGPAKVFPVSFNGRLSCTDGGGALDLKLSQIFLIGLDLVLIIFLFLLPGIYLCLVVILQRSYFFVIGIQLTQIQLQLLNV